MILALNKEHAHMVYAVTKPCECTQSGTCSIDLNVKPAFVNQLRRATGCSELPSNSVVRQKLHLRNYYLTSKRSRRAPQAASALCDMIEQCPAPHAHLQKQHLPHKCATDCRIASCRLTLIKHQLYLCSLIVILQKSLARW